jgi:hypothetical protein
MNPPQSIALRTLLETQRIAALGTLHDGEPAVSLAPYAILPDGRGFVIHVSGLAAHTGDMLADPRVSLLVVAAPEEGRSVRALARATIRARSERLSELDPRHEEARYAYLERFPESEPTFGFGDFSLFLLEPREVRFVGGFAQAVTMDAAAFAAAMKGER